MYLSGRHSWIKCMVVSKKGELWAGTEEGIRIWNNSGKQLQLLNGDHSGAILSLCLAGPHIWSSAADGSICVWRCSDRSLLRHHKVHRNWVNYSVNTSLHLDFLRH